MCFCLYCFVLNSSHHLHQEGQTINLKACNVAISYKITSTGTELCFIELPKQSITLFWHLKNVILDPGCNPDSLRIFGPLSPYVRAQKAKKKLA